MTNHDHHYYNLLATLHDQLEDIGTYERYLKESDKAPEYVAIWERLKTRAEESVNVIRGELEQLAAQEPSASAS